MAFGKVDPTEVLGMTPDELKDKLSKVDALESRFATFETKTSDGLNQILDKLKDPEPEEREVRTELDFLADPAAAVSRQIDPLAKQTLNNTIMLQHRAARETYPKDFERWGTEIVKKMSELSVEQQADQRVWNAMVLMVRGSHADELEKDGATGKFGFLEPVSAGLRPDPKDSDNLNGPEREMVKTLAPFGMTADKYKKGKERLEKARAARLGRFAEVS